MKYYDTHYEEYIQSVKSHNIHPELKEVFDQFPKTIKEFGNIIVYGPCGSGKYSQVLFLLEKYSPTHLKYDKRITVNTEKQSYIYRISDIHYEIDMGLLGCHSKLLWHELFFQIVDII
jgi:Cdc6-like AAA superfamily ATPase